MNIIGEGHHQPTGPIFLTLGFYSQKHIKMLAVN